MPIRRREFLGMAAAVAAAPSVGATLAHRADAPWSPSPAQDARARPDPWIELSAAHLEWNLRQIEQRVKPTPVMAVVKANGYGHGLVEVARVLARAGVRDFLTGKLDEARALRAAGVEGRILNFGPLAGSDAEEIVRLGVSQNVFDSGQVQALAGAGRRLGRDARVQIKVDTGLGRFGVAFDRAVEFILGVNETEGVAVDGVFTTFSEDDALDARQLRRMRDIAVNVVRTGARVGLVHAASSAAILDFPESCTLDLVRPGIMLYGLYPSARAEQERKIDLRPVLSLKARAAQVKTIEPGESVGYHRAFTATQRERVATLAVGYSDGLPRALAGRGDALIGGRRCRILTISANAAVVRLGEAPCEPGDEAVLLGAQGEERITAGEVGAHTGASVYAVVMEMSALLPRVVV